MPAEVTSLHVRGRLMWETLVKDCAVAGGERSCQGGRREAGRCRGDRDVDAAVGDAGLRVDVDRSADRARGVELQVDGGLGIARGRGASQVEVDGAVAEGGGLPENPEH